MTDLRKMQEMFQAAVLGQDTAFLDEIAPNGRLAARERLGIYQHAYGTRLTNVLKEDFPVLHGLLGEEDFQALANRYIEFYPSDRPSLRAFGRHMEILTLRDPAYRNDPLMAEMARFEWAFHDVFDAADADSVTVEDVMALSPDAWTTLRLDFHPTLFIAPYQYNIAALWSSRKREDDPPVTPRKTPELTYIMQWRHGLTSHFRTLDHDEAITLLRARKGTSFPDLCEVLARENFDKAPERAAEIFRRWVEEGIVTALHHLKINV